MGTKKITEGSADRERKGNDFIEEEIAKEAYFIYLSGANPDNPDKDWQDAKAIVKNHFRYIAGAE
jgi:hypothetical protein